MCFFDKDSTARVRLPAVFFYLHSKDVNSFSCLLMLVTPARFIFIVYGVKRDYQQSTPCTSGFHSATTAVLTLKSWTLVRLNMTLELTNLVSDEQNEVMLVALGVDIDKNQLKKKKTMSMPLTDTLYERISKLFLRFCGRSCLLCFTIAVPHVCCASLFSQLASWLAIVSFNVTVFLQSARSAFVGVPNRITGFRKYWTHTIFMISNWGKQIRKDKITPKTPHTTGISGRKSVRPPDNQSFADFVRE